MKFLRNIAIIDGKFYVNCINIESLGYYENIK